MKIGILFYAIIIYRVFEAFILIAILVNSLALAVYDYSDRNSVSKKNKNIDKLLIALTVVFIVECGLKIIAYGFVIHRTAYLKSGWNIVDFLVVIFGYPYFTLINFIRIIEISTDKYNIKTIRVFRVLKPLRSMTIIPGNKRILILN